MKNLKRTKQLQEKLSNLEIVLEREMNEKKGNEEVKICDVAISMAEAVKLHNQIEQIVSRKDNLSELKIEKDMIPIQLVMISADWMEVQNLLNELD